MTHCSLRQGLCDGGGSEVSPPKGRGFLAMGFEDTELFL